MSGMDDDDGFVVRVRGLPWSATEEKVVEFFGEDVKIADGKSGVHLTLSRDGRASGEAYVQLESEHDLELAKKKHKCNMDHRYIEVFRSKKSEMDWVVRRAGINREDPSDDGCVRLRGLPFGCTKEEVANFFSGLEVVPNGITLPKDGSGRASGEAFVQFINKDVAEKALLKNKERMGHRYIEIFRSSVSEIRRVQCSHDAPGGGGSRIRPLMSAAGRPTPYDRCEYRGDRWSGGGGGGGRYPPSIRGARRGGFNGEFDDYYDGPPSSHHWPRGAGGPGRRGSLPPPHMGGRRGDVGGDMMDDWRPPSNRQWRSSTGHTVHMRGLPYRSPESDVYEFFAPLRPVNVHMLFDDMGRPSGQANVDFATHDHAMKAMQKDKCNIGHRYIELFLNSTPDGDYESGGYGPVNSDVSSGGGGAGDYEDCGGDYDRRSPPGSRGYGGSGGRYRGGGRYGGSPGRSHGGGGGYGGNSTSLRQQDWGNDGSYSSSGGGYNGSSSAQMTGNNYNSFM